MIKKATIQICENNIAKNILSVKDSKTNVTTKFTYQIEDLGLKPSIIHRNLSSKELIEIKGIFRT